MTVRWEVPGPYRECGTGVWQPSGAECEAAMEAPRGRRGLRQDAGGRDVRVVRRVMMSRVADGC